MFTTGEADAIFGTHRSCCTFRTRLVTKSQGHVQNLAEVSFGAHRRAGAAERRPPYCMECAPYPASVFRSGSMPSSSSTGNSVHFRIVQGSPLRSSVFTTVPGAGFNCASGRLDTKGLRDKMQIMFLGVHSNGLRVDLDVRGMD